MAKHAWRIGMVVAAVLSLPGYANGSTCAKLDLIVRIDNYAGVRPELLSKARVAVEEIFGAAGVRTGWDADEEDEGGCGPDPMRLTLLVVTVETDSSRKPAAVLGLADRPSRRAFVFYNRLLDTATSHSVDPAIILGRVMAHELGHLLLPLGPHARFGLMREDVDLSEASLSRFSETEVRQLRGAIQSTRGRPSLIKAR